MDKTIITEEQFTAIINQQYRDGQSWAIFGIKTNNFYLHILDGGTLCCPFPYCLHIHLSLEAEPDIPAMYADFRAKAEAMLAEYQEFEASSNA